jgi:hypothetical protein
MAKKEFTGVNITLPTCRLAYPVVFEKQLNTLKGKEEWAVTMLYDKKTADLSKLKEAIVKAAKLEFSLDVDLKTLNLKRIIDGDTKDDQGNDRRSEYKGQWIVKAATRLKAPGVVDKSCQKILDPGEIYSGVYANVNVTVKAYTLPSRGVTLYLNHIQKVRDGEPISGGPRVEDVFEEMNIDAAEAAVATEGMDGMFS